MKTVPRRSLFAFAYLVSLVAQSGNLGGIDTTRRLQVTHSLWTDAPPVVQGDFPEFGVIGRNGVVHAYYGIGQSLVMLPADVLATSLVDAVNMEAEKANKFRRALVALITFPLLAAVAITVAFALLQELGFSATESFGGCLGLQLGTSFLHYSQFAQENSLLLLLLCTALFGTLRWVRSHQRRWLFVAASALGFELLVRLTTVLDLMWASVFIVGVIWSSREQADARLQRRRLLDVAVVAIPTLTFFGLLERAYHWIRFGSLSGTYIGIWAAQLRVRQPELPPGYPFSNPFWNGFLGPIVSPEKSVFLFDPLLIASMVLVVCFWRELTAPVRMYFGALVGLLVSDVAFHATLVFWGGDSAWGNRYTTVPVQLLALLAVPVMCRVLALLSRRMKAMMLLCLFLSVVIQAASVVLAPNLEFAQRLAVPGHLFVVGRRMVNIVALATGHFDDWGLSAPGFLESPIARHVNLVPFTAGQGLPSGAANMLLVAWASLLLVVLVMVWRRARFVWRAVSTQSCGNSVGT